MNHDDATSTTAEDSGELQQWIDDVLRSSTAAELEAAPTAALAATSSAIAKRRRHQRAVRSLSGLAAAAALVAAMAWRNSPLPRREGSGEGFRTPPLVQTPVAEFAIENPSPSPSLQGRVTNTPLAAFVAGDESIAIELDSPADDVTVVQLYTTTDAQRRQRTEIALRTLSPEQPGG